MTEKKAKLNRKKWLYALNFSENYMQFRKKQLPSPIDCVENVFIRT